MATLYSARTVVTLVLFLCLFSMPARVLWADTGLVTLDGYALRDDQGPFLALGATYFLALKQERDDEAQLISNLEFLSQQGFDYIRILSMVSWGGGIIPPRATGGIPWNDYWSQFRQLVDRVYDDYGMRTQITIFADADNVMNQEARRIAHVNDLLNEVVLGREEKIILIEVANEHWKNGVPLDELKEHGCRIAAATDVLVALSSPAAGESGLRDMYLNSCADIATIHFPRICSWKSVFDCENVYTCWHCLGGLPQRASSNEPEGPGSSVCQEFNLGRLVMAPAVAWHSRLPMYVFHSRPGITADNQHLIGTPYELDNPKSFEELFRKLSMKGRFNFVKSLLPADLPNWTQVLTDGPGNPFRKSQLAIYRSPASVRDNGSDKDFVSLLGGVGAAYTGTLTATTYLREVEICNIRSCTYIGDIPQGMPIEPRSYYNSGGFILTGKIGPLPENFCNGELDYRGADCNTWKRYQCAPGTDCDAHGCTYQGSPCYWMCHWGPYQATCEDVCDSMPLTPCYARTTQGFCEQGWGCFWGSIPPPPPPTCKGTLDYRGDNCNALKRYQCGAGTDCEANSCTYQGSPCFWPCNLAPYGYTCEDVCDNKPFTPCEQRSTQAFCEKGWGCYWE